MSEWSLARIEGEVDKTLSSLGLKREFPISINGRLSRTLGRVRSIGGAPISMEFSKELVTTASDNSIMEVILHETAHAIVLLETHTNHGHDAVFKSVCSRIGCKNDTATTEVEQLVGCRSKYEVMCPSCGVIGQYARKCKTITNIKYCSCSKCGETHLKVVQNWG